MDPFLILRTTTTRDYELLDSGDGEKLERYGAVTLSRPDPQALWPKKLPENMWRGAKAKFARTEKSGWRVEAGTPKEWNVAFGAMTFLVKPTAFKHVGVFPEQLANWEWSMDLIRRGLKEKHPLPGEEPLSVLNLFGYTGGATIAALLAGASVTHVDASKVAIEWAKKNAELSGVIDRPVRWMLDDARSFLRREIKRGKKYDAIIMDPPAFGHGAKGELWKIEQHLLDLFSLCKSVLSSTPLFFLVNGYASGYSAISYQNNLMEAMQGHSGSIEIGELTIEESRAKRLLPAGIFARWHTEKLD
jgi:23S rRNA (cytosine1962-C5)-methyltransferase